jgi:hypothetical protein
MKGPCWTYGEWLEEHSPLDADADLVDRIFRWGNEHWNVDKPGRLLVVCPTRQIAAAVMLGTMRMQEALRWNGRTYDVVYHGFVVSFIAWCPRSTCGRGGAWHAALYHAKTDPHAYVAITPCLVSPNVELRLDPMVDPLADIPTHTTWTL